MSRAVAHRPLRVAALVLAAAMALSALAPAAAQQAPLDASQVLAAVVGIRAEIRPDARTAAALGTERAGSGVVRATRPLGVKPIVFGTSADLAEGAPVLAVSHAGPRPVTPARVVSRRTFAGYWEYLLEDAIFTSPPHPFYGGAALIGVDGRLLGVGSLMVGDATQAPEASPGNMFVPIDGLKPILADLLAQGRSVRRPQPWLGVYTDETQGRVFITRLATGGPGERAGLRAGDIIIGVGGRRVRDMADFLRKVWSRGDAGARVPLDVLHLDSEDMAIERVDVESGDRYDWLRLGDKL